MDMITVREHLKAVSDTLLKLDEKAIAEAVEILYNCRKRGNTVYTFGNGGSAATASHFANDLLKMCDVKALCISDMTPTTLAYGNDDGWENMFKNPLIRMGIPGDVVVAFSCSGKSINVLRGLEDPEAHQIFLTGNGNYNTNRTDICVPHPDIKVQEDVHLAICHAIAGALKL